MGRIEHPFTWAHYRRILAAGLAAGYRFIGFDETAHGRHIYLRHDIDNDIAIAHRMAAIEHEMGVKATYLVLIRSANYNPAERRCVHMLEEMAGMGHEIGLHFSLVDHPERDRGGDLPALVRADAELLAGLLHRPVGVFGFHNPSEPEWYQVEVPGLINAYADRFTWQAHYISESNMRWRDGCPCEVLAQGGHDAVQLLVHPLSFAATLASDRDVLVHYLGLKLNELLEYNIEQNRVLRESGLPLDEVLAALGRGEEVS